jgi:hypothetical protein
VKSSAIGNRLVQKDGVEATMLDAVFAFTETSGWRTAVFRRLCGLVVVLFSLGCGYSGPPIIPIDTAPVNGIATFEGKPLEDYRVYFYCASDAAKEPASDRIKPDGSFSLSVRKPGDGAIIGTNKVWFRYDPVLPEQTPGLETAVNIPPPKVKLPEKYLDGESKSPRKASRTTSST